MSGWSSSADRSSIPSHLPDHIKDACVRTTRGWELPAGGNNSPLAQRELIVAMGLNTFGEGPNEGPTAFFSNNEEGNRASAFLGTFSGVSGSAINAVVFEVFDLEQDVYEGLTASSASLPSGLALSTAGDYAFQITGTPLNTDTASSFITVGDGASTAVYGISWSITE